jgi:ribosome-interacting GTPase 1
MAVTSACACTVVSLVPRYNILHEYKLHNAHIVIRQDVSIDEFIDVIEGNRKYIRCLYVYNKVGAMGLVLGSSPRPAMGTVHV